MCSSIKNTYLSPRNTREPARFPSISQPKIIGHFSLNENRQYFTDARNCKYVYKNYKSERVEYDLNDGIEHVKRKPDSAKDEKITHLLEFIIRNKRKLRKNQSEDGNKEGILLPEFICFRGLLRMIMCSPYEQRDSWTILATKYKGSIYLCAEETEKQIQERMTMTSNMKRILSYGFKFEQYILSGKLSLTFDFAINISKLLHTQFFDSFLDDPNKKPDTNTAVDESEEFCCMFSTTLNGQRIVYGAEMDGIESNQILDLNNVDLNRCNFIELKVKLREQHHRQKQNYYRYKLRNWWCQCFLVNVQKVIVGTRNENGIVNEISSMTVKEIPKQCQVKLPFA